ncbi:hypothetical protein [uncultured Shewanella sp.]|uniref:hypothetical protein n=1 Tax=uncultured Shewanella sp. TaxID=173975 RepID=UPI0026154B4B|nr:hypothetical protein [uncultured Shewanella sp.]
MIDYELLGMVCGLLTVLGFGVFLILMPILNFKLRKNRRGMVKGIIDSAPQKLRDRLNLLMENGTSWLVFSGAGYLWFTYFTLRYGWRIPKSEIVDWRKEIKIIFGKDYGIYRIFLLAFNFGGLGFVGFCIYNYLTK